MFSCKFIVFSSSEKGLEMWIQQTCQVKGEIDPRLGPKGFFKVIFANLEDKDKIVEGGLYFYNSADHYIIHWEACFGPHKEDFLTTPVWVRHYSLPIDFLILEILEGISHCFGRFVKNKQDKNMAYS